MHIMGFLLLGESRVKHDTDGKTGILWSCLADSQAFRGLCQANHTLHWDFFLFIKERL